MASEQLQVTWLDVGDSRCPEGVSCVWEGEVTITIGVVKSGQDLGVFDIRLHDGEEDEAIATVDGQTIHFLDMVPLLSKIICHHPEFPAVPWGNRA